MDKPERFFEEMATLIKGSDREVFGGAVVVVPPVGEPIVFMLTDPTPKLAHFWSGVSARVEVAAAEAQRSEQDATSNFYGGRR